MCLGPGWSHRTCCWDWIEGGWWDEGLRNKDERYKRKICVAFMNDSLGHGESVSLKIELHKHCFMTHLVLVLQIHWWHPNRVQPPSLRSPPAAKWIRKTRCAWPWAGLALEPNTRESNQLRGMRNTNGKNCAKNLMFLKFIYFQKQ